MNNLPFDTSNFQFPGGVNVSVGRGFEFNPQNDIADNFDDFDYSSLDFNDPMLVDAWDFMDMGLNLDTGAAATGFNSKFTFFQAVISNKSSARWSQKFIPVPSQHGYRWFPFDSSFWRYVVWLYE